MKGEKPKNGRETVEKEKTENALLEKLRVLEAALEAEKTRTAALEGENDDLKQENWELKIDPGTGLERRGLYFESLDKRIEEIISDPELAKLVDGGSLSREELQGLDTIPLSVTAADLGYLSKYNEDPEITKHYGEHAGGDAVLEETGKVIQQAEPKKRSIKPKLDIKTRGYRVGGDEFSMVHESVKEDAKQVALEFALKQGEIKIKGADLPPMINCGTASFREAAEAFVEALPAEERQEMSAEEKAKKIQKILTSIADRRSKVAKGIERLTTMTRLLATDPEKFRRNHKWLQKGAFGMVEQDFAALAEFADSPEKMEKAVRDLVKEKLEVKAEKEANQELKERAIIVEIADRDF